MADRGIWPSGTQDALKESDNVIIDELYKEKLGVDHVNQVVEINGRRARVVGFTRGIRSFTTSPYVFTSFKNAQNYTSARRGPDHVHLLVKVGHGASAGAASSASRPACKDVDVYTTPSSAR